MDAAYLHDLVFNIETKRKELEQQNLDRHEINRWFENHYRAFSKKGAFTCLCCNKPVNMNLTKDAGRPFYFRHFDDTECSYSENSKTYDKHISKHENKAKKDIGLTVFREILDGNLKPYGVEIERGFHYKKKLSFIPDFIVRFPSTEELWAIDYYTAMSQGLTSGSYARHLSKRMKTYEEEGFKVFSFVDSSWISFEEETNKGTLLAAESYVTSKTQEDLLWDTFLKEKLQGELLNFFLEVIGASIGYFNTRNIAYVDIYNRQCNIFRFIETSYNNRNLTFYKLSSSTVQLEKALTLNPDQNNFNLTSFSEEELRSTFLNNLIEKKKLLEIEQRQKEEQKAKKKAEEEEKQSILKADFAEWLKQKQIQTQIMHEKEYEEIEKEMQERARFAALRPIGVDPNQWNYRYSNYYNQYKYSKIPSESPPESTEKKMEKQKNEKVKDQLLSQPITGEIYIDGDKKYWRLVILKWVKENQYGDVLNVSIQKLIQYMKSSGVSFNQQDKLAQYPIKNFLEYYEKLIKKELKKKLQLIFSE